MDNNTNAESPFAGVATASPAPAGPQGATDKQKAFLRRLLDERPTFRDAKAYRVELLTKRSASEIIDWIIANVEKEKVNNAPASDIAFGIYFKHGEFYRVYLTRESKQKVAAKLLVVRDGKRDEHGDLIRDENGYAVEPAECDWEYLGKAGLTRLTPDDKCSHEEASKFGAMYGVCCACAADLNNPISVYHGYGPVCAGHNGWPRLTPRQLAKVYENRGVKL